MHRLKKKKLLPLGGLPFEEFLFPSLFVCDFTGRERMNVYMLHVCCARGGKL